MLPLSFEIWHVHFGPLTEDEIEPAARPLSRQQLTSFGYEMLWKAQPAADFVSRVFHYRFARGRREMAFGLKSY